LLPQNRVKVQSTGALTNKVFFKTGRDVESKVASQREGKVRDGGKEMPSGYPIEEWGKRGWPGYISQKSEDECNIRRMSLLDATKRVKHGESVGEV